MIFPTVISPKLTLKNRVWLACLLIILPAIIYGADFSLTGTLGPSLSMEFDENRNGRADITFMADLSGNLISDRNDFISSAHLEWDHENHFSWQLWEAVLSYRPIDSVNLQAGKIIFPWGIGYSYSVGDVMTHKVGEQSEGFWGTVFSYNFTYDIVLSYLLSVDDFIDYPELSDFSDNSLHALYLSSVIGPVQTQASLTYEHHKHLRPSAGFSVDLFESILFLETAWDYENRANYYDQGWQESNKKGDWFFNGGVFKSISFYPMEFSLLFEYLYHSGGYSKEQWEDYLNQLVIDPLTTSTIVLPDPLMSHSLDLSLSFSYDKVMDVSAALSFLPEDGSFVLSGEMNGYLSDDLDLSLKALWLSGDDKSIYGSQEHKQLSLGLKYYF